MKKFLHEHFFIFFTLFSSSRVDLKPFALERFPQ